jgi:glycosyltransferase involved in cell wall biosynthesis
MAKVSVVIPVFNAEKYISRCLDSVINQTFKDIEIICINDNSQDNSVNILNEYSSKDKRIKVYSNNHNIGAALSRNIGIDNAKGEYIYFIDVDDFIDENYIEIMFSRIEKEKCDIALNMSILTDSNGNITPYKHPSMPDTNKDGEYLDNITTIHDAPCFIWARIFRKSFLNDYNLRFLKLHADDVVFTAITTLYADKTFVFYGANYHYTVNNTGLTALTVSKNEKDIQHIKAHSMIYDYLKEHNKLDNRLKLFRVYPFIKVDAEEKFNYYKKFFEKIKADFINNENIYNDLEKFFAYSILNSADYEEYLKHYNKVVTIGFIRRRQA